MCRLVLVFLLVSASIAFAKDADLKEGTYYTYNQIGIKKKKEKGGQLKVEFQPKDEQFYWCPGIKIKKTDKATIVTFVRCKTSKNCSVDKSAKIGKRLERSVSFSTNGKDVYVRNSPNNYRRIYKTPDSKLPDDITIDASASTKTKTVGGKQKTSKQKGGSGNSRTVPLILRPSKKFI